MLRDLEVVSRAATEKPPLTLRHKIKRISFAKAYKDWTIEKTKRILWSDESVLYGDGNYIIKVRQHTMTLGTQYKT